jgi:hypothetical protein
MSFVLLSCFEANVIISTVETVFGIIKQVLGFRQFLLRGLDSVQNEWGLVCIGWNLKRMRVLRG